MADEPTVTDDLDAFSVEFFNKTPVVKEDVVSPLPNETPDDDPVEELDEDAPEGEDEGDTQDDGPDEEPEEEPKKKPKRSAQERIDELTRDRYEQARDYDRKIAELEAKLNLLDKPVQKEEPPVGKMPDGAPDPNGEKDGQSIYPLGEFDPEYIRDLTRFTIKTEQEAAERFRLEKAERESAQSLREAAHTEWTGKLEAAQTEVPDIRDKINSLEPLFVGLDTGYGQYLVDVIMSLENGPQVLAYCADNPKEAREIVSSGAAGATVRLGRLDARMSKPTQATEPPKRVSKAPAPAQRVTRGTAGQFSVPADTDDLDAFEREFYRK